MPAYLIGLAMGIYGVWNAINDPILGQMSDRTRSRWGRRRPYMIFGSIPFVIFFTLVWTPPVKWMGGNTTYMLIYFIAIIFLFDLLYTLVIINWTALFPEMYKTQEERTKVSVYRQIFGIVGNILGVALPPILYVALGWQTMGVIFGVLTLIFLLLSISGSREDPVAAAGVGLPLIKSLKATFGNKSFLIYVLAAMFVQFTFIMLQAVLPFYAKYVIHIEGFQVSLMLGVIFIMAMFWVIFWGKRANRKGSKNTIILSSMLYAVSLIGYNANLAVDQQPTSAITGMKVLLIIIPIVSVAIAILFYRKYPLHGEKLREVKENVKKLHEGLEEIPALKN